MGVVFINGSIILRATNISMASLVFTLDDGSTFSVDLDCELLTIGRHEDSMVPLNSPSVSGQHATVRCRDGVFYVQDLGSRNGTRVNGAEVEEAVLNDGDRVAFGDVQAIFCSEEVAAAVVEEEAAQPVVAIPEPVYHSPPPAVTGIPAPAPRPVKPRRPVRAQAASSGEGCMNAVVIIGLFLAAFVIGLALRHYSITERFILNDVADRIFKQVGRIKIEQTPETK